jgi:hypothetical protein
MFIDAIYLGSICILKVFELKINVRSKTKQVFNSLNLCLILETDRFLCHIWYETIFKVCNWQIHIRLYLVINCSKILINTPTLVLLITLSGSEVFLLYFIKIKPYIYVFNFQKRFLVIIWFAFLWTTRCCKRLP